MIARRALFLVTSGHFEAWTNSIRIRDEMSRSIKMRDSWEGRGGGGIMW